MAHTTYDSTKQTANNASSRMANRPKNTSSQPSHSQVSAAERRFDHCGAGSNCAARSAGLPRRAAIASSE